MRKGPAIIFGLAGLCVLAGIVSIIQIDTTNNPLWYFFNPFELFATAVNLIVIGLFTQNLLKIGSSGRLLATYWIISLVTIIYAWTTVANAGSGFVYIPTNGLLVLLTLIVGVAFTGMSMRLLTVEAK